MSILKLIAANLRYFKSYNSVACGPETLEAHAQSVEQFERSHKAIKAALRAYRKAFIETVGDPSVTSEMEAAEKKAKAALKL